MNWYNFETMFISLATKIGDFLHEHGVYFEVSKNGKYYHFEILTDDAGREKINGFLDNNTLWNRGV